MYGCLGWEWLSQLSVCVVGMPRVWLSRLGALSQLSVCVVGMPSVCLSQLGVAVTAACVCCRHATCVAVSAGSGCHSYLAVL